MKDSGTKKPHERCRLHEAVFEQSAMGIALCTPDGRFVEVNDRFCELTGCSGDELKQNSFTDIIHPEDAAADRGMLEKLTAGDIGRYTLDIRCLAQDGTFVRLRCTVTRNRTDTGVSGHVIRFIESIHAAENELNEQQKLSHDLAERVKELNCAYAVSRLVADPAITADEVIRQSVTLIPDAFQFPERTGVRITYEDRALESPQYTTSGPSIRADIVDEGRTIGDITVALAQPVPDNTVPFLDDEQHLINDIGRQIGMKITQQHAQAIVHEAAVDIETLTRVQSELIAEKTRLQQVLEIAGSFIILIRPDQTIDLINRSGCEILGYDVSEIIGQKWYDTFIPEELREDRKQFFFSLIETQKSDDRSHEVPILTKDGSKRILLWRNTIIRNGDGTVAGVLASGLDITERKTAEEAMADYAHRLEETNSELESFSYSVSHDLRAPLRAIDGYSRMIIEDYEEILDEDGKRKLNVIRHEALKMGELIDDLLKFSRMGRQEIKSVDVDMRDLIEEVFASLAAIAPRQDFMLKIADMPYAHGDRAMLHEVVLNLLSNAMKFSGNKERPEIICSGIRSKNETVFCIEDNGVGFDMRYINKLFGVFQRLHSAHEFEGTGVGLALVQRIIHKHGGRVWAEGEPDHGAKFYFSLPHPKE